jgi:hypothetical protein
MIDTRRKRGTILTLDEQLSAFLEAWSATRAGQIEKYRLRAARHKNDGSMIICYESDLRSLRHYEHEAAMLSELQKRALGSSSLDKRKG